MAIRIRNLTKTFGDQTVYRDFSLRLPDTGCVCLFGPSGSGKTSLLQMLTGLLEPDEGVIELPPGCQFSYAFQEDRLLPWNTAAENIRLALEGLPNAKSARSVTEYWLKKLGLSEYADKLPGELSGGMRQLVSLVRVFAHGGNVLLLDEPFQGIDAQAKEGLFTLLDEIKKEKLVVLITHYPEEAVRLADFIHILHFPPVRIAGTITVSEAMRADRLQASQAIKKLAAQSHQPD